MNPSTLAALALEVWRASGPRTETRRDSLLRLYAESYWGSDIGWSPDISALVSEAQLIARQRTRIDELSY